MAFVFCYESLKRLIKTLKTLKTKKMKINSVTHGLLDYLVVVFLAASPKLFHLPEITSMFTYALAGVHLLLTILTNFKFGLIKIIPFRIHGIIELLVSLSLVGVAFYFGSIENELARNFYLCFAGAVFLTWILTDYNSNK